MKKILCVAMVLLMLGSLAACGAKKPDTDAESPKNRIARQMPVKKSRLSFGGGEKRMCPVPERGWRKQRPNMKRKRESTLI